MTGPVAPRCMAKQHGWKASCEWSSPAPLSGCNGESNPAASQRLFQPPRLPLLLTQNGMTRRQAEAVRLVCCRLIGLYTGLENNIDSVPCTKLFIPDLQPMLHSLLSGRHYSSSHGDHLSPPRRCACGIGASHYRVAPASCLFQTHPPAAPPTRCDSLDCGGPQLSTLRLRGGFCLHAGPPPRWGLPSPWLGCIGNGYRLAREVWRKSNLVSALAAFAHARLIH